MRRSSLGVAVALAGSLLAACSASPSPVNSLEQEIATVQRLLPGQYFGKTPDGIFRLWIRPAMAHRFLVEARDADSKLVARGELTIVPDAERRRVALLYRPGVPGRGLDGRPMDEPPGLHLDRSLAALELICRPWVGAAGEESAGAVGMRCVSSLQRSWEFTFDETGMELRRGAAAAPIRMTRQAS